MVGDLETSMTLNGGRHWNEGRQNVVLEMSLNVRRRYLQASHRDKVAEVFRLLGRSF
jgi:hypothetical protein